MLVFHCVYTVYTPCTCIHIALYFLDLCSRFVIFARVYPHTVLAQVAVYRKTRNHSGSLTVSGYGWEPAERYKPIVGIAAGVMQSGVPLLTADAHQELNFVPGVDIPATGDSQVIATSY